ncbi:unnamed protein product [Acanthoscelides obtectus]|uniref:Uncharacterized protein n=1 Tax=Acanthoscelides obtectus TaxID=200917 RepID=A0A9P0MDM4_ACAOB|nr:unnamed protein product [Acanthoscelides obtectus]CAK1659025.1 15-hydroxyprostaglandin dehydrogenase [NAD(+)] [Acanthoscelides obtectus]
MVMSKFFVRNNFSLRSVCKDYATALEARPEEERNVGKGLTDREEVFFTDEKGDSDGRQSGPNYGRDKRNWRALCEGDAHGRSWDEDEESGKNLVVKLSAEYGPEKTAFIRTNFACDNLLNNAFEKTLEHFQKIDVLVNIANSVGHRNWETEIDKNVKGIVKSTLLGYKYMDASNGGDGGSVLNMVCDRESTLATPYFEGCRHYLVAFGKTMSQQNHINTGVKIVTLFVNVDDVYNQNDGCLEKGRKNECDIPNLIRLARTGSIWTT